MQLTLLRKSLSSKISLTKCEYREWSITDIEWLIHLKNIPVVIENRHCIYWLCIYEPSAYWLMMAYFDDELFYVLWLSWVNVRVKKAANLLLFTVTAA